MSLKLSYSVYAFIAIALILTLFGVSQAMKPDQHSAGYWKPVEKAIGKNGMMLPGNVFKIDLTRSDKTVSIGDVRLKPAMALDSWVSFMRMGDGAMMMGDIVLIVDEMMPVQQKLSEEGIDVTAIHNTLIGESPQVYDLHISGKGDPVEMAKKVRSALNRTGMASNGAEGARYNVYSMDVERLDNIMARKGTMEGGVYLYSIPRAEKITVDGMEMPPTMDVATVIKFQPLGDGKVAITGDFILRPEEVSPVFKTLNENGIVVTALHTHMLTEEPRLFMMHFWATGDAEKLAVGLRQALDNTNSGSA